MDKEIVQHVLKVLSSTSTAASCQIEIDDNIEKIKSNDSAYVLVVTTKEFNKSRRMT